MMLLKGFPFSFSYRLTCAQFPSVFGRPLGRYSIFVLSWRWLKMRSAFLLTTSFGCGSCQCGTRPPHWKPSRTPASICLGSKSSWGRCMKPWKRWYVVGHNNEVTLWHRGLYQIPQSLAAIQGQGPGDIPNVPMYWEDRLPVSNRERRWFPGLWFIMASVFSSD